jgi:hypothetical protein
VSNWHVCWAEVVSTAGVFWWVRPQHVICPHPCYPKENWCAYCMVFHASCVNDNMQLVIATLKLDAGPQATCFAGLYWTVPPCTVQCMCVHRRLQREMRGAACRHATSWVQTRIRCCLISDDHNSKDRHLAWWVKHSLLSFKALGHGHQVLQQALDVPCLVLGCRGHMHLGSNKRTLTKTEGWVSAPTS